MIVSVGFNNKVTIIFTMDSLADDFKTALTLKVPTSISEHFSDDEPVGSDSSSVGDCFGSQGGSEGR